MKEAMKKIIATLTVTIMMLALATTAFAESNVEGYTDVKGQVQSDVDDGSAPGASQGSPDGSQGSSPVAAADSGSLPFTGLDMGLLVGAGGVLVAAGLGMRRLTRPAGTA